MSKARDLAGLFNLNPTSGTTAQRPATADVGDIYYNGTTGKTEIYTTTGWKEMASGIPFGNTAGRPANTTGQPYFNGETNRLELYTAGSGWQNIIQEVPGVASITGNYSEQTNSGTITIAGTNFVTGAIASAIGTNGVEVQAQSTTYNSLVQLTAVFTGLSNANEPYDIKVTNPSNLFGMIPDALYINASPVWQTASGSLGAFAEQVSITLSALSTTDSDSQTITYVLASGSSLPSGVSLNSATGVISGTLPNIATDTTYSFSINASDGLNIIPRTFSINSIATFEIDYLVVGGGGGAGYDNGGGGGGGGLRSSVGVTGGGGAAESKFAISPGSAYSIAVGTGGRGTSDTLGTTVISSGNPSSFATITALGGGRGGISADGGNGISGGSGGGAKRTSTAGAGTSGQGFPGGGAGNGYTGAGGGGAGQAGQAATSSAGGKGGDGLAISITGSSVYYAGGGGGGFEYSNQNNGGAGGSGGGGNGGARGGTYLGGNGTNGLGGGGGGTEYLNGSSNVEAGMGGSGVVILKYPSTKTPTISGGLTSTTSTAVSGFKITTFTAGTGTVTF